MWVLALKAFFLLTSLGEKLVLARLLSPHDFGLVGICLLTFSFVQVLSETGVTQALVHEEHVDDDKLDAAWALLMARGLLLGGITFATAGLVADFFDEPAVAGLQRCLALVFVLDGMVNPGLILFRKELTYGRLVLQQASGLLVELAVAITLAVLLHSAWALALGIVSRYATQAAISYLIVPYRPRFRPNLGISRRLFKYGKWISVYGLVNQLNNQGDDAVVGRILGAAHLGLYQMAFTLSNLPATQITHVIGDVAFPAYVKIRDRGAGIARAYLTVLGYSTLVSVPVGALICVAGPEIVDLALGEKWAPMAGALQVLAIWGIVRSVGANTGPLMQALGKPKLLALTATVRLALMAGLIVPLTNAWGIVGAAWAVLIPALLVAPVSYGITISVSRCGIRAFLFTLIPPVASSVLSVGAMLACGAASDGGMLEVVLQLAAGTAVYCTAIWAWGTWGNYAVAREAVGRVSHAIKRVGVA